MTTIQIIAIIGISICAMIIGYCIGKYRGFAQGYYMGWHNAETHHQIKSDLFNGSPATFTAERLN